MKDFRERTLKNKNNNKSEVKNNYTECMVIWQNKNKKICFNTWFHIRNLAKQIYINLTPDYYSIKNVLLS